ncbi:MAG: hypothetical protein ACI9FR_000837 [Cryomorphaceae bacterium]|jgi:hypothetical protein
MKLTPKINRLLIELTLRVSGDRKALLIRDENLLRKNLLALYRTTDDEGIHDLVIQIMAEGGYSWFAKLALGANRVVDESRLLESHTLETEFQLSDGEFMDLIPANAHFH